MSRETSFLFGAVSACLAFGAVFNTAGAVTFVVDSTADDDDSAPGDGVCSSGIGGPCTLRAAVMEANTWPGVDIIQVPAGTYRLERGAPGGQGEDYALTGDLDILEGVSIYGAGTSSTIIDGTQNDRIFHTIGNITVHIEDLAIVNGQVNCPDEGGGIYGGAATLELRWCDVADNAAWSGGGVFVNLGRLQAEHCRFADNEAAQSGGGIYALESVVTLTDECIISGNTAVLGEGGGVYGNAGASITLDTCAVFANEAGSSGGGLAAAGPVALRTTAVGGNFAQLGGGGIFLAGNNASLTNCTISENTTNGHGGGMQVFCGFSLPVPTLDLTNVTITENSANADADTYGEGGGIYNEVAMCAPPMAPSVINLANTIVADNDDSVVATIHPDCSGPLVSQRHNLIGDNTGCAADFPAGTPNANDDWVGTSAVPVNPLLSTRGNYTGFTMSNPPESGSPAIDHGCPGSGPGTPCAPKDQHGWSRPIDGDGDSVAVCDIGAIEYRDCNGNNVYDGIDIVDGTSRDCDGDDYPDECVTQCTADCLCHDWDPCTWDRCFSGVCHHDPATYGDCDHNGTVNVFDVFCVLEGIARDFAHCSFENVDIHPCTPNDVINVFDALAVLGAIQGQNPCNCPAGP